MKTRCKSRPCDCPLIPLAEKQNIRVEREMGFMAHDDRPVASIAFNATEALGAYD